jgi:hypothetical protein
MAPAYYNQPNQQNKTAMKALVDTKTEEINTFSGFALPVIPWDSLDIISTGAVKELIRKVIKKEKLENVTKSNHRNDWGYLPGNRYFVVNTDGKVGTTLFGAPIEVSVGSMQFGEFFFANGNDLKMGIKNGDRRIVYDREKKYFYLTLTHYDKWVHGPTNDDGSPKNATAKVHNPFVRIDGIPYY